MCSFRTTNSLLFIGEYHVVFVEAFLPCVGSILCCVCSFFSNLPFRTPCPGSELPPPPPPSLYSSACLHSSYRENISACVFSPWRLALNRRCDPWRGLLAGQLLTHLPPYSGVENMAPCLVSAFVCATHDRLERGCPF